MCSLPYPYIYSKCNMYTTFLIKVLALSICGNAPEKCTNWKLHIPSICQPVRLLPVILCNIFITASKCIFEIQYWCFCLVSLLRKMLQSICKHVSKIQFFHFVEINYFLKRFTIVFNEEIPRIMRYRYFKRYSMIDLVKIECMNYLYIVSKQKILSAVKSYKKHLKNYSN